MTHGEIIRQARHWRGMTLETVAALTHGALSQGKLSKIELGDRGLKVHELLVIAAALDVPPESLLTVDHWIRYAVDSAVASVLGVAA